MSVLINIEMPTSCGFCLFETHTDDGYECCINGCLTEYQKRPSDCPLVPVPAHGRLIDADALMKELKDDLDDRTGAALLIAVFLEVLKSAPTIIPAEEGE